MNHPMTLKFVFWYQGTIPRLYFCWCWVIIFMGSVTFITVICTLPPLSILLLA